MSSYDLKQKLFENKLRVFYFLDYDTSGVVSNTIYQPIKLYKFNWLCFVVCMKKPAFTG